MGILTFWPSCEKTCYTPAILAYCFFALAASMQTIYFGCVGLVVDPEILGTATGIMLSIGSGLGAIYPIIAGSLYENYKD